MITGPDIVDQPDILPQENSGMMMICRAVPKVDDNHQRPPERKPQ